LGKIEAELKTAGAIVYAISNEDAGDLKKMKDAEKLGDSFVFLSDTQAKAADLYAGHYDGKTILKPATFVIGKNRKIVYAYVGEDFKVRASAQAVLDAVKKGRH
jgi:peroxiredoxin